MIIYWVGFFCFVLIMVALVLRHMINVEKELDDWDNDNWEADDEQAQR